MVNKPKKIGTEVETHVARYMRDHGWPDAKRNPPGGSKDVGDIDPRQSKLVVEVKADRSLRYPEFLRETETERVNAGAAVGVCIIKPPGVAQKRMGIWWMLMSSGTFDALALVAGWEGHRVAWHRTSPPGQKAFHPGKILAYACAEIGMSPGTQLLPGARKESSTGWDMRFLYLRDGLQLLRDAGLGGASDPNVTEVTHD